MCNETCMSKKCKKCSFDSLKRTPHKHADLIKAWADGAEIQYKSVPSEPWSDCVKPAWFETCNYRIKPEPSDLEKYGVEVGDFWCTADEDSEVVTGIGKSRVETYLYNSYPKDKLISLIFRRGVVNKL